MFGKSQQAAPAAQRQPVQQAVRQGAAPARQPVAANTQQARPAVAGGRFGNRVAGGQQAAPGARVAAGQQPARAASSPKDANGLPRGLFSGIKQTRMRMNANYVRRGHYLMRVNRCKADQNRKYEDFVAFEMTVIHVFDNENGAGHRVGEDVSHLLMRKSDYFLAEIKAFIAHIFDMSEAEIDEEACEAILLPEQPLANAIVEVKAYDVPLNSGKLFTRVDYIREVSAREALENFDPQDIIRFFPGGYLERKAELEEQAGGAAPADAGVDQSADQTSPDQGQIEIYHDGQGGYVDADGNPVDINGNPI